MKSRMLLAVALVLTLSACGYSRGTRAVTGGAIGAGTGAVVGGATGAGAGKGALIGGVGGAGVGALTGH
jgi:osmotically inducible lipoprotein OsmB